MSGKPYTADPTTRAFRQSPITPGHISAIEVIDPICSVHAITFSP